MSAIRKRLGIFLSLPFGVLVIGTVGFMVIEKLPFIDAIYFTIVTISTVGYGDITPSTSAGKIFGVVLIIIGIGTFLGIVTNVTHLLMQGREERLRKERLNTLIGIFFSEIGNQLLRFFVRFDTYIEKLRQELLIDDNWSDDDFARLHKKLQTYEYTIDFKLMELEAMRSFLGDKSDLLIRLIESESLLEHESFTGLLWAVSHLKDELVARTGLSQLPESDLAHLANDARRAYILLGKQWTSYMQYLKHGYPYLFSLAFRTNPFSTNPSPVIEH